MNAAASPALTRLRTTRSRNRSAGMSAKISARFAFNGSHGPSAQYTDRNGASATHSLLPIASAVPLIAEIGTRLPVRRKLRNDQGRTISIATPIITDAAAMDLRAPAGEIGRAHV